MQSLKELALYTKKSLTIKDTYAIKENLSSIGLSERILVETAGVALAENIGRGHKGKKLLFVCGIGGKGAIGLSAARRMLQRHEVNTVFIGSRDSIKNQSTKLNFDLLNDIVSIKCIDDKYESWLPKELARADVVIDAIVGCGMRGRLAQPIPSIISLINSSGAYKISIDLPSGINADTGMPSSKYIKADQTLTIHKPKVGIASSGIVGYTVVVDIGVPISAEIFAGPGDISLATEPRRLDSSKYTNGAVLVVGGGRTYHGAPLLAAFAANAAISALRTGAGYVTVAVPKSASVPVKSLSKTLVVKELEWEGSAASAASSVSSIKHDAMVIGPGLDEGRASEEIVSKIIKQERMKGNPVVVDATAIGIMGKHRGMFGDNLILTPHYGEFKKLSGTDVSDCGMVETAKKAANFAKANGFTLVLKGHSTIITNGDRLKINRASTMALAKMGSGDVLSGIIAAYAAVHRDPFESSVAGVYAHSRIGDLLYASKGYHITAEDVIDTIPDVLRLFDSMSG